MTSPPSSSSPPSPPPAGVPTTGMNNMTSEERNDILEWPKELLRDDASTDDEYFQESQTNDLPQVENIDDVVPYEGQVLRVMKTLMLLTNDLNVLMYVYLEYQLSLNENFCDLTGRQGV